MSATVGMLSQYADTTKWKPTLADKDFSRKALQDSAWADVSLVSQDALTLSLTFLAGPSRHCSCLCYVQSFDNRLRPIYCQTWGWHRWPFALDASPHFPARRPGPRLGRLLLHSLGIRQLIEAHQACSVGSDRYSFIKSRRELLQAVLATLPSGNCGDDH